MVFDDKHLFCRNLGEKICSIEMNTKSIPDAAMKELETMCNRYIRENRKMYPTYYDSPDDPAVATVCWCCFVHS